MAKPLVVHPEVKAESQTAYDWYFERNPRAAERFFEELESSYAAIAADPQRFAAYPFGPGQYLQFKRFPYVVIYLERDEYIGIFAVAHTRRDPGYWAKRIDGYGREESPAADLPPRTSAC